MMAGLEQNQIAGLASGILLYGKRRRRLENTMFFCAGLPCMELLLLAAAAVVVMENSKMYSPTASRTLVGQQANHTRTYNFYEM